MGWLIAIAVIAGILLLPLGISASYDSGGAKAAVAIGPLRIPVYPGKKKKEDKPKEKPEKQPATGKATQKKSGGPATDFIPLVKLILELLNDFRGKLRVNLLELNVILAGSDPCDLGQNYGKACAALGNLWPQLERYLVIRKRDVKLQCDFEAEQTLVTARLLLTITVGRLFSLGLRHGIKIIKEFLSISKKRKGGART